MAFSVVGVYDHPSMQLIRRDDRRAASRPKEPVCPLCRSADVNPTVRTAFVIYYRCAECGMVWNIEKPEGWAHLTRVLP